MNNHKDLLNAAQMGKAIADDILELVIPDDVENDYGIGNMVDDLLSSLRSAQSTLQDIEDELDRGPYCEACYMRHEPGKHH